jgi:hypothetical protein
LFGRISSLLPATHPWNAPLLNGVNTNNKYPVTAVATGTNPMIIQVPLGIDGMQFNIRLIGRAACYTGSVSTSLEVNISLGTSMPGTLLASAYGSAPASQSDWILPFSVLCKCTYDSKAQMVSALTDYVMGGSGYVQSAAGVAGSAAAAPTALSFMAYYNWTPYAVLGSTRVEILDFSIQ